MYGLDKRITSARKRSLIELCFNYTDPEKMILCEFRSGPNNYEEFRCLRRRLEAQSEDFNLQGSIKDRAF